MYIFWCQAVSLHLVGSFVVILCFYVKCNTLTLIQQKDSKDNNNANLLPILKTTYISEDPCLIQLHFFVLLPKTGQIHLTRSILKTLRKANASRCTQFIHLRCSSEYYNKILVVLASIDIIWHLRAQQRAWEYKLRTQCTSMWAWPNYLCPNCWLKPRSMRICSILLKLAIKFRRFFMDYVSIFTSNLRLHHLWARSLRL